MLQFKRCEKILSKTILIIISSFAIDIPNVVCDVVKKGFLNNVVAFRGGRAALPQDTPLRRCDVRERGHISKAWPSLYPTSGSHCALILIRAPDHLLFPTPSFCPVGNLFIKLSLSPLFSAFILFSRWERSTDLNISVNS